MAIPSTNVERNWPYVLFAIFFVGLIGGIGYLFFRGSSLFDILGAEKKLADLSLNVEGIDDTLGTVLPMGARVPVNLILATNETEVESIEAIITYDPRLVSALELDFSTSEFSNFEHILQQEIIRDENAQEIGVLNLSLTAIPAPPYTDTAQITQYAPIAQQKKGIITTITFRTLQEINSSTIGFKLTGNGRNDTNVALFDGEGSEGLGETTDLVYEIVSPVEFTSRTNQVLGSFESTTSSNNLSDESSSKCTLPGDLDCSGTIGVLDLNLFISFLKNDNLKADFDSSNTVDGVDLRYLLQNFAQKETEAPVAKPTLPVAKIQIEKTTVPFLEEIKGIRTLFSNRKHEASSFGEILD